MWLVEHSRLLINDACYGSLISDNPFCHFYHEIKEALSHILRDCSKAKIVCVALIDHTNWYCFQVGNICEWMKHNLTGGYDAR